jgi:hypothetical protein
MLDFGLAARAYERLRLAELGGLIDAFAFESQGEPAMDIYELDDPLTG